MAQIKATTAELILASARERLANFIGFETQMLYTALYGTLSANEEAWVITDSEIDRVTDKLSVRLEVDNSYLDVEDRTYESRDIESIAYYGNGEVTFTDTEGCDYTPDDFTLEELGKIANALEKAYTKKVTK